MERKEPRLTRWQPKEWRPEYATIVGFSALGKSHSWISENVEPHYTTVHISNIVNLPQAKELRGKILAKIEERATEHVSETLERIGKKALRRVEQALNSDDIFEKSPFHVVDRSIEILKGLRVLKTGGSSDGSLPPIAVSGNAMFLQNVTGTQMNQLVEGLNKANEAREIHAGREVGSQ